MDFKKIVLFFSLLVMTSTYAQKKNKEKQISPFELSIQKYHNALKYLDYNTAINSLQEILVLSPEKITYKDSLLALYYNAGMSKSAVLLAQEMEVEGNTNLATYEVLARTFQKAGMLKEALLYFEKLNALDQNLYYLYQIATLQFNLARVQECEQNLIVIINHAEAKNSTIEMEYENQVVQQVPYAAAAYNIMGVLAMQIKEMDTAKENFQEALNIFPVFLLAKNNLSMLKE